MRENNGKKLRSIAVVMVMVLAALTVTTILIKVESVGASVSGNDGYGNVSAFTITSPTGTTSVYKEGKTVKIAWDGGHSTNATGYNITIKRQGIGAVSAGDTIHSVTNQTNTSSSYNWTINNSLDIGTYIINVTSFNWSTGQVGNATDDNVTIYITYGTPGHDAFQGGNETVASNGDPVLSTSPTNLVYDPDNTIDITVNLSQTWGTQVYYLYKPQYNGTAAGGVYGVGWDGDKVGSNIVYDDVLGGYTQITGGSEYVFSGVTLDRAGLWVIAPKNQYPATLVPNFSTYALMNSTVAAWFWVNGSTGYTLTVDDDDFAYNSSGALTLEVKDSASTLMNSVVDIRCNGNTSSIYGENKHIGGSTTAYKKNNSYGATQGQYGFWSVGNYTAYGYADIDTDAGTGQVSYYTEYNMDNSSGNSKHWNSTYGANSALYGSSTAMSAATTYNWTLAGGFDPPEYEATPVAIQVETGTPYTSVANATQYYGFDGEVNITIRESSSGSKFCNADLDATKIYTSVYCPDDVNVSAHVLITNETASSQGFIQIYSATWGQDGAHFGGNGTWKAIIYIDRNVDRASDESDKAWTEEWNTTVEWTVTAAPTAQFKWIDDDGKVGGLDIWGFDCTSVNENTDGVIPYVPAPADVPLDIEFQIRDSAGGYFGDLDTALTQQSGKCTSVKQCAENITISGDTLFTGTLDTFPGFDGVWTAWGSGDDSAECGFGSDTTWHVPIIPTMSSGGGSITIKYTAYNTSGQETLTIGGTEYASNGSIVTVSPNNFKIHEQNQTLTITATNAGTGTALAWHNAYLYYLNDTGAPYTSHQIDYVTLDEGGGTLIFNKTMQTTNQTSVDFDGDGPTADSVQRAPRNLTIYFEGPTRRRGYALVQMKRYSNLEVEIYPTTMLAGYKYSKFYVNCTFENSTATPEDTTTDKNNFHVSIKDEDGSVVTTATVNRIDQTSDLNGAYSFSFSNAWVTTPGTYTFYCYNNTYDSAGYNATLVVEQVEVTCDKSPLIWNSDANISATFTVTYNGEPIVGTLRVDNVTLSGNYNRSWALCNFTGTSDQSGENTSITINPANLPGGVVTIHDLTADHLDTGRAARNITFWFKPNSPNAGAYARCIGRLPVKVPTVTPTPQYIPLGETSKVKLTTTGRGVALADIFVGLDGRGITIAGTNGTTGADGSLTISVTPSTAGNMDIHVGEDGRIVTTKVIVTAWELVIDAPVKVNEGIDFIVTLTEKGSGDAVEGVDVKLAGVGTVQTDADGIASFSGDYAAPQVSSDMAYTLVATKEGYVSDTASITIVNIPQLTVSLKPATAKRGAKVVATVSKDDATPAVNALVTIEGSTKEYYTDGSGQVTITASSSDGTYTVTAAFGAFLDGTATLTVSGAKEEPTPGFELLTLIAAIGVAFILLRRRRRK